MLPADGARAARSTMSRTIFSGTGVGKKARQEYREATASRTSISKLLSQGQQSTSKFSVNGIEPSSSAWKDDDTQPSEFFEVYNHTSSTILPRKYVGFTRTCGIPIKTQASP